MPAPWSAHVGELESGGIGIDDASAEGACAGEAIERLTAYPLPDDQAVVAAHAAWPLDEPPIAPESWVLFHADQYRATGFPFRPLTRSTVCPWVCCRQAVTGLPFWVPAELAYLNPPAAVCSDRLQAVRDDPLKRVTTSAGHQICPGISTGLACGRSGDSILLRGLQEVIERDAVVGAWWGRYALEEHPAADVFARLGRDLERRLRRPNLRYRCYRVAGPFSRHVTLVTVAGDDREGYCFSIGSACRETRTASWTKSAMEAVHGRHYIRHLKSQASRGELAVGARPGSFAEHALWYTLHPGELARTMLRSPVPGTSEGESIREELPVLIERLGVTRPVLFRSMTPPPLASEGVGWHVLRVIVPGLQPLHGNHSMPQLGGPLWSPRGLSEWTETPPHPFP
jgi:ribosomal protein S12 methylthiotransferase accessory factor